MSTGARVSSGESVTELSRDAVYLAPSGRRCRWWPSLAEGAWSHQAMFIYDLADGRKASSALSDGFVLTRPNWRHLRRVS